MFERIKEKRANEEGFTLIELLIVIVILGILAAIVVFSVGGITNTGTAAACKSDAATINTAAEAYYAQSPTLTGATHMVNLVPSFLKADGSIVLDTKTGKGYTLAWVAPGGTEGAAGGVDASVGCAGL
jgi:prepilin-type N-terminal cleavage/methylation domain-containing protein